MRNVHLVCEGRIDSLDREVLDRLLLQIHRMPGRITAAGGESSLGSIASWLEDNSRPKLPGGTYGNAGDVAICITDRNYHSRQRHYDSWANVASKRLVWLRHEIENYLLEPAVVLDYFRTLRQTVTDPWAQALPDTEGDVETLLATQARLLLEDPTGRVLLEELRVLKGNTGTTEFGSQLPQPSPGALYPDRGQWLALLQSEVARLQADFTKIAGLTDFQPPALVNRYDTLLAGVQQTSYFAQRDYLTDVSGKDLFKLLGNYLRVLGAKRLTDLALANDLLVALARVYRPGTLFQPDEFHELADRLRQFASGSLP